MSKYIMKRFSNSESDDKKLEREKSKLAELEDRQKSGKKKLVKSSIKDRSLVQHLEDFSEV